LGIGKKTFLVQEFVQMGFRAKFAYQRTVSFDQQL